MAEAFLRKYAGDQYEAHSAGRHDHRSFEDPAAFEGSDEEKLAKFYEVRDQIDQRIKNWLREQDNAV